MEYISIKEASEEMGKSVDTVRNYLEDGTLTKYLVFKNNVRIDRAEVEELMKARVAGTIPGGV